MKPVILFVDDDASMRKGIQRMLWDQQEVWELQFAEHAKSALEILHSERVDTVITDHNMPGMTGLEFVQAIRANSDWERIPIVMLTGCNDRTLKRQALVDGATDLLSKPVDQEDLVARIESVLRLKAAQDELADRNVKLEEVVRERTRQLEQSRFEVVLRLSKAAECHDVETGNHTLRVGFFSKIVAKAMGQSEEFCDTILLASPLHDIGKIGVSDQILRKPGSLTPEEITEMRRHCEIGHKMLTGTCRLPSSLMLRFMHGNDLRSPFMDMAATIALQHHEKWDGSGYPQGLIRAEIELPARIVAVADVFDALRSERPYKAAFSEEKSLAILNADAGTHFDPTVVQAFCDSLPEIRKIGDGLSDDMPELQIAA